jgi:subtilisin family serine protease
MPRRLLVSLTAALITSTALAPQAHAAPQLTTWHAKQVRLTAGAQSAGRSGSGVLVAVIDTWVDTRHPAFGGRVLPGVDCTQSGKCNKAQVKDSPTCDHGTHVVGTVAASDYGLAPAAKVLPIQILKRDGDQCVGNTTDAAAAIRYAVSRGAKVINLSVGGTNPLIGSATALPGAVSEAAAAGVTVVFAAGNNSGDAVDDSYGNDALIVAATEPDGSLAEYSQRGAGVDVAAPGGEPFSGNTCRGDGSDCVASTAPGGEYFAMAGTSMAAPHVAGMAALLLGQRPSRGRSDVVNRITGTARPVSGGGSGLIDVNAALGVRPAPAPTKSATSPPTRRPTTPPRRATTSPTPTRAPSPKATPSAAPSKSASTSPTANPTLTPPVDPSADPTVLAAPDDAPSRAVPVTLATALLAAVTAGHAVPLWRRRRAG